jgi:hypothetical protein
MTTRRMIQRGDMDYDFDESSSGGDEDDLSDLLDDGDEDENEEGDEDEEEGGDEDEGHGLDLAREINNLYKMQDDRDSMLLDLAKSMRVLAKRQLAKESSAFESDNTPYGDGAEGGQVGGTESMEAGLTAEGENPQGIAHKALAIAKSLNASGVDMGIIAKSTGLILKDDKWSNFGDKDSNVPGNEAVTPGTMDWAQDQTVVPGSAMAPSGVKGISKALNIPEEQASKVLKALVEGGIIKKAMPIAVGTGATGDGVDIDDLEQRARDTGWRDLNRMREAGGLL